MLVHEKVGVYIADNKLKAVIIARNAGIEFSEFIEIMNGRRKMSVDELRAICYALGVNPEAFIEVV